MIEDSTTHGDGSGRILGEVVVDQEAGEGQYFPVALDGLLPGTVLGFQVHVRLGRRHVLVHGRKTPFSAEERERILLYKQPTVFVPLADTARYQEYIESYLTEIVRRSEVPEAVKAGLVYRTTKGLMREILSHPDDPLVVERSRRASEATVGYILRGRDSFLNLLSQCSFDYRTYTHSVNVCIFSVALARQVGMEPENLADIGTGVLLHDIGKTRVDPSILHKTGPLTQAEWSIMKKHPEWGIELVRGREGVTPGMVEIILHHHEKLDGSGYPHGLREGDLPPPVRIITLCDIFDALTTNRSYRSALSTFDTLALIHREMTGLVDQDLLRELVLILKAGK
jgi:putative nucleotidyltransferase with HDIG domain